MKHTLTGIALALAFFGGLFLGRVSGYEQGYCQGIIDRITLPERIDDALPLPSPEAEQTAISTLPPAQ